ncbi:peptidoglycan-binding protein [Streptomyces thinghirensis]|nr:peptidoglycan-binding protein [Streptomyces thinghirensis]
MQKALAELGYASDGDPAGTFGAGTERAVERFTRRTGTAP